MPRALPTVLLFALALSPDLAAQQPTPAWETSLEARRQQLITSNGPGTDTALRSELLTLRDQDQAARGFRNGAPATPTAAPRMASNLAEIDAAITTRLRSIVGQKGWPTIALVGYDASNAAMLLLTHSADHAWQQSLTAQLATLADQGKIDGSALALVIDKQLVAAGKPQRYGSQFKFVDGEARMYAVEDPGGLDQLRARTLLPPMDVYRQILAGMYHLKTSNRIASPTPPAVDASKK